jgi:hypothetical protein
MKQILLSTIVAYVVLLGAPRDQSDFAMLALRASLFFAEVGILLAPRVQMHQPDYQEPIDQQDARHLVDRKNT